MANYNWENARSLRTGLQFSALTLLIIDNLRNISFARNRQFNVEVQPKNVHLSWKQVKDKLTDEN